MFFELCDFIHELKRILTLAEFALNNTVHASTGLTPFFATSFDIHEFQLFLPCVASRHLVAPLWEEIRVINIGRVQLTVF